jgi:hypothetical protein
MEMNGKGDKPRPVDKTKFDANHDDIRWKSKASGRRADQIPAESGRKK